ncbi:MAG TPA: EF-hand domain-containing protein [Hyphomonadaceae bacterium]|nr:EF-hand domain-containing protein [Hyphomonadaceae bacterium]
MKGSIFIAFAALAVATGLPVHAQTQDQVMAFLDKDNDGKVSLNEYLTFEVTKLKQADADGDGALSLGEFKTTLNGQAKANASRLFDTFNIEDDRKNLTQREFLGYQAFVFKTYIDTDHDGFMSGDEWAKVMKSLGQ